MAVGAVGRLSARWEWNGLGDPTPFGLDNYNRALRDPLFISAFRNTALWLVIAVTVPTVAGLGLAVLLDRPLRASRLYKSLFYLPICLSLVVVGQVWIWIYQPDWGLLNTVLEASAWVTSRRRGWATPTRRSWQSSWPGAGSRRHSASSSTWPH